ncbi:hypothetical protein [Pseudomonas sp. SDO5591_S426]
MDKQEEINRKVEALARLKIEVDLLLGNEKEHMKYVILEAQYNKAYAELSSVVDFLKEKIKSEVLRIRSEEEGRVADVSAEENRRLLEKILMFENRIINIEDRLKCIDERLKRLLDVEAPAKVIGVRKLDLVNWRGWTVEDKLLAFFYFVPVLIVVVLLCSAIYRIVSAQSVEINVELNIAELIGGSLIGLGAAFAGGAYAFKTYKEIKVE